MSDQSPDLFNTKFNFGNTVGILTINGDGTSAQTIIGNGNLIVSNPGPGVTQVSANNFGALPGFVPSNAGAPPGSFLRFDGVFAVPGGGGGGITSINADITPAQTLSSNAVGSYFWTDNGVGDHKLTVIVFGGGATPGLVPSAAGSPANSFLKNDGTWAIPAGGGGGGITSINGDITAAQSLSIVTNTGPTQWNNLGAGAHQLQLHELDGSLVPAILPSPNVSKLGFLNGFGWSERDIQQNNWGGVSLATATPTVLLTFTCSLPGGQTHEYLINANGGMNADASGKFWVLFARKNGVPINGCAYTGSYRSDTNTQGQIVSTISCVNGDVITILINQEAGHNVNSSGGAASIMNLFRIL